MPEPAPVPQAKCKMAVLTDCNSTLHFVCFDSGCGLAYQDVIDCIEAHGGPLPCAEGETMFIRFTTWGGPVCPATSVLLRPIDGYTWDMPFTTKANCDDWWCERVYDVPCGTWTIGVDYLCDSCDLAGVS
jgi:hypothetical protein